MSVLASTLSSTDSQSAANRDVMLALLSQLEVLAQQVLAAGGPKAVDRHHSRDKLIARERVDLIIDAGAPFLELSSFAGADDERRCLSTGESELGGRSRGVFVGDVLLVGASAFSDRSGFPPRTFGAHCSPSFQPGAKSANLPGELVTSSATGTVRDFARW
jgi:hypothetical protein